MSADVVGRSYLINPAQVLVTRNRGCKGGRISEETDDGDSAIWRAVIGCDPGRNLSISWHPGRDPAKATVVAITFAADSSGCAVHPTHAGVDILGPLADAVSTSHLTGCDIGLGCYADACVPVAA